MCRLQRLLLKSSVSPVFIYLWMLPLQRHTAVLWWRGVTKLSLAVLCVDITFSSTVTFSSQNFHGQSSPAQSFWNTSKTLTPMISSTSVTEELIFCRSCFVDTWALPDFSTKSKTSRWGCGSEGCKLTICMSFLLTPKMFRNARWKLRQ